MGQSQSKRRCHSTYSTYWNYKYMNKSADLNKTNVKKDKIAKNS